MKGVRSRLSNLQARMRVGHAACSHGVQRWQRRGRLQSGCGFQQTIGAFDFLLALAQSE